ncbi:MAG TPA: PAS domain S-box protein [Candidatus Eisenbacteria bacterium]|jgi:PAS domain S-box-containing protein
MAVGPPAPRDPELAEELLAILSENPLERALARVLGTLAEGAGAATTALFRFDGSRITAEHWSAEPQGAAGAELRASFRGAAEAALGLGTAPAEKDGSGPGPRVRLVSGQERLRGAVCLSPHPSGPPHQERWIALLLGLLGLRLAVHEETAHSQATRIRYERWFKTLDEQLRVLDRERQKFAAIVHQSDARVFVTDLSRVIRWTNTVMGEPRRPQSGSTWVGLACRDVCADFEGRTDGSECDDCPVVRTLRENQVVHREVRQADADGARNLYFSVLPIKGPDGRPQEAMVMIQDLSDLEVLRKSEARYRLLFERSAKAIVVVEPATHRVLLANPMASRMTGRPPNELLTFGLEELHSEPEWRRLRDTYRAAFDSGSLAARECRVRTRDGTERHAMVSGTRYDLDGQEAMMLEFQDITETRQVEEALQKAQQRLRTVVANTPIVLFALDRDGIFTLSEGKGLAALGLQPGQVIGQSIYDLYREAPEILENVRRATNGEEVSAVVEVGGLAFETCCRPLKDAQGQVTGVIGVATDVTDRRRLEGQLRHAQRMEAIGRLAGGVAHDFNNLLAAIVGHSEMLMARLAAGDPLRHRIEEIRTAGERGALLTRQLLAFSRKEVLAPTVLDVNGVVAGMDAMLRRLIGEDIELLSIPSADPAMVKADRGQLEQVIMNLAVNGRDAMPQGGRLTIEVGCVDLDQVYAQQHARVTPGPHVVVSVSDTGCGMDAETLPHIFEPFFTTKARDQGTGLGLATVYGVLEQCGGHVWVYSEPGLGATFKVYFPRVEEPPAATASSVPGDARRGVETVLLVEDDDAVRSMARELLEEGGYQVLEARHGAEALQMAGAHPGTIHLLVTDVVMPHMGGGELAQRLGQQRPGIRVLFVSGYTDDAVVRHGVLERGSAFLQKPFSVEAFSRRVREVLDGPQGMAA